ncbi:hypothetical protein SEA_SICARIUS2_49 [Arthrobacter phage Sicarius2]|uniref:Uncharacterized protein n=1 Tax=Arthrobacter phage Sicarius2 TaxID=2836090 RepID=A0A8F3INZ6_9CAUD|nr:hypothetical protein SEA_SICARIUS2_49 [Arthrobacter phage Sicarius2]
MSEQKSCPDDGRCWHECVDRCFRVNNCGPLSGVFDGNEWPDDIKTQHAERKIDVVAGMQQ